MSKRKRTPVDPPTRSSFADIIVRWPGALHRRISAMALAEGVSVNDLVLSILSEHVGRREALADLGALLPHSQDARRAAQAGIQADALALHRRQNAARHAKLSGRDVANALGATPAGKAPKRAAAAHAARTPPRKARR